jgi:hypothetical protein
MPDALGQNADAFALQRAIAKGADGARLDAMGIANEAFPNILLPFDLVEQKHFDFAMGIELFANETRRDDLRVVTNKNVAFMKIGRQIKELFVLNGLVFSVNHHEAAFIALLEGALGNEFFRQREIEKIDIHF